jgi:hypothetical protein
MLVAATVGLAAFFGVGVATASAEGSSSGGTGSSVGDALGAPNGPGGCNIIQFAVVPGVCVAIELYQNIESLTSG